MQGPPEQCGADLPSRLEVRLWLPRGGVERQARRSAVGPTYTASRGRGAASSGVRAPRLAWPLPHALRDKHTPVPDHDPPPVLKLLSQPSERVAASSSPWSDHDGCPISSPQNLITDLHPSDDAHLRLRLARRHRARSSGRCVCAFFRGALSGRVRQCFLTTSPLDTLALFFFSSFLDRAHHSQRTSSTHRGAWALSSRACGHSRSPFDGTSRNPPSNRRPADREGRNMVNARFL